jgi:hypothetical protein
VVVDRVSSDGGDFSKQNSHNCDGNHSTPVPSVEESSWISTPRKNVRKKRQSNGIHQKRRLAVKTLVHFRTHDENGLHWDPFYTIFSLIASVVLAALVVFILVSSAT